jgi:hypothetical protein
MVTAHKGFNSSGSDVKMWSIKKLSSEPIFTFSKHSCNPYARFLETEKPLVLSAGQDSELYLINEEGQNFCS